jgi:hypothetical protein
MESIGRENFPERRLSAAIVTFRQSPEHEHLSNGYWHGLGSRCTSILRQGAVAVGGASAAAATFADAPGAPRVMAMGAACGTFPRLRASLSSLVSLRFRFK